MSQPKYVQPKFGRLSLGLLALILVGSIAYYRDYCRSAAGITTPPSDIEYFILAGHLYGWASCLSWMLSVVERRYLRWCLQLAVVSLMAGGLHNVMPSVPYARFFSSMGGLVFVQTLCFHLLRVPRWRTSGAKDADRTVVEPSQLKQFGIGELIATTAALATIFAIMERYQPANIRSFDYWWPLIILWFVLPLSSILMTLALLGRRHLAQTAAWVLFSFLLAAGCGAGLAIAQVWLTDSSASLTAESYWEYFRWLSTVYGILLMSCASIFTVVTLIGRWQNALDQSAPKDSRILGQGLEPANE